MCRKSIAAILAGMLLLAGCATAPEEPQQSEYDQGYEAGYEAAQNEGYDHASDIRTQYEETIRDMQNEYEEDIIDKMQEAYAYGYDDGINGREYGYSY